MKMLKTILLMLTMLTLLPFACAEELADRLRGMLCHVNLIPVNAVEGKQQRRSSRERIRAFTAILEKKGINTTVRRTLGSDINASCGQLRRQQQQ